MRKASLLIEDYRHDEKPKREVYEPWFDVDHDFEAVTQEDPEGINDMFKRMAFKVRNKRRPIEDLDIPEPIPEPEPEIQEGCFKIAFYGLKHMFARVKKKCSRFFPL